MFTRKTLSQHNTDINLLDSELREEKSISKKKKIAVWKKTILYFIVAIFIVGFGFFSKILISSTELAANLGSSNIFNQIKNLFLAAANEKILKGEEQDRINILFLGIGGQEHPGPFLTDTIILISIRPSTKQVVLLSIPRDLSVPIKGYGYGRINSAYAMGKNTSDFYAAELAKQTAENVLGDSIDYYALIDFSGFEKIIDALGGIDIDVEKSFYDPLYPTLDYKTTAVSFEQGLNHFDGARALIYARSRHGNNNEGSDFARAKRQQQVILAVRGKLLSLGILLQPTKVDKLLAILNKSLKTDLEIWEITKLYQMLRDIDPSNIATMVIEEEPKGPLVPISGQDGAYLLTDKDANYANIKKMVQELFGPTEQNQTADVQKSAYAQAINQPIKIILQNGTNFPGLASYFKTRLESGNLNENEISESISQNIQIVSIENAKTNDFEKTVIYDLKSKEDKSQEFHIKSLREILNANIAPNIPSYLENRETEADVVVILGKDQLQNVISNF